MKPYYQDDAVTLYHGDCIAVMRELPDSSVDAVVTDPPYGINFMGKAWDGAAIAQAAVSGVDHTKTRERSASMHAGSYDLSLKGNTAFGEWSYGWATEALRVLKPGGHLLAFGGTRTWHRLAVAIEDAGFEVRDSIAWMYGSGFPKSLDVSKAIDKAAGAEREVVGKGVSGTTAGMQNLGPSGITGGDYDITAPATPAARQWQGWGTALKPAFEPVVVARKPLIGTVAENVLTHGTGALNVDRCRLPISADDPIHGAVWTTRPSKIGLNSVGFVTSNADGDKREADTSKGRWPANVILDESQAAELDRQSGEASYNPAGSFGTNKRDDNNNGIYGGGKGITKAGMDVFGYGDRGGASRFFYTAKADSSERPRVNGVAHPTVKPLDLMRYLVRLVTPPGGTVLEPFAGSGTTLEACIVEGFSVIGIELTEEYLPLITQRITKPIEVTLL